MADVLAARLSDDLVWLVTAHGAAGTIQRWVRGMLGRKAVSALADDILNHMAVTYLLACTREGLQPFGTAMPTSVCLGEEWIRYRNGGRGGVAARAARGERAAT